MASLTEKQRGLLEQATQQAERGDLAGAAAVLQRLLKKSPGHPDVLFQLAGVRMRGERYAAALPLLEKLTRSSPGFPPGFVYLALCHRQLGRHDHALKAADAALRLQPTLVEALLGKAELLHMTGDYQGGYDLLQPHIGDGSAQPRLVFEFARLAAQLGHADEARASLDSLAARDDVGEDLRSDALFELAAVHERAGSYDLAWSTCVEANELQQDRFDPTTHEAMIEAVITAWTAEAIAAIPAAGVSSDVPVFIVGMPRSGTSLVEQILSCHPAVHGAGELPDIFRQVRRLQPHDGSTPAYVDDLSVLTRGAVDRSTRAYLKSLTAGARSALRVADKQVFNFLYLGVIRAMFPDARVVHCVRDPRDVAVSCYFQSFMGRVYFANRLPHIGVFHAAYRRLMTHWASVLDGPLLEVNYERMTSDQETVSRELIEFTGLDWDDACLRFHENRRVVQTATIDQVRRPMYRSSVGRWRHYERQLEPILGLLATTG